MRVAVVGSGPTGWSAATKLIELGHDVTVIDTGLIETDPFKEEKKRFGVNRKLDQGSDLPYRSFPFGPQIKSNEVDPIYSFARGGLSLVWGATMLPYCKQDTESWPFDTSILESKFHEISKHIPITGAVDGLSPTYGNFYSRRSIFPSNRIIKILENIERINSSELIAGLSRLAVETGRSDITGCVYCNRCIDGCPYGYIWSTRGLHLDNKALKLRVLKVQETQSGLNIDCVDIQGQLHTLTDFEKIFLAPGSLESFRILANSKMVEDQAILKDSATFFIPLLAFPKIGLVGKNSFGLSQLFIRMNRNERESASQYQIYEYSEELIERAKKVVPLGSLIPSAVFRIFLKRMLVGIGYLDGADSPAIQMKYLDDKSIVNTLEVRGKNLKDRNQHVRQSIRRLSKLIRKCGLLPLPFLSQIAPPGGGVHSGSWLPMGEKSDLLGRPPGVKNIHVIDSSILPTIAPGPITYTVMANAMRIVEEAVR